jgi:hypothetical protein
MMDRPAGAPGESRSESDEQQPREGDQPGAIADVSTGRIRPADVEHGSPEAAKLDADERGALAWLLTAEAPPPWEVEVQSLTPQGFKPLLFVVLPQDGRKIVEIEDRNTAGSGPQMSRKLDEIANNAELVAESTTLIEDPFDGTKIDPGSPEFRGPLPSKALAMERRFARQAGLLMGLAMEVRRISGYNSDHVGKARQRVVSDELVSAVGGS